MTDSPPPLNAATDPRPVDDPAALRIHGYLWVDACGWV